MNRMKRYFTYMNIDILRTDLYEDALNLKGIFKSQIMDLVG